MGQRVPYSRNSPAIFSGDHTGLLTNGGLKFKDGTIVHPYAGDPNGALVLPKGSVVMDTLNAEFYQATDSLGTYRAVGSSGAALELGFGLEGDGTLGNPLQVNEDVAVAADKVDRFGKNTFQFYPPKPEYAGTVRQANDEATLIAAIAAAVDEDIIELTNNITLTATLVINKQVFVRGVGGATLQTAGAGTDPVTMISVTANGVGFDSTVTLKHRKTTNTSVECAVSVSATDFYSAAHVEFMEFGYVLRGSFTITGSMTYTGALGNSHRFIAIYKISDQSQITELEFDAPQEATARSNFILVSSSVATDVFDSHLRVHRCHQYDMTKYIRQFYMQDAVVSTADGNASLEFVGNSWNDLNGGIGLYVNRLSLFNFFYSIAIVNNWQGDAAIANYKGLMYIDSPAAPGDLGSTLFYYGGNRHGTVLRSDYTSAYDVGGICYKNTAYTLATTILSMIQMPDGTEYDSAFRNLYDVPTAQNVGSLIASTSAITLDDLDRIGVADTSESSILKSASLADLKAFLKTYFDTLYGGDSMAFANVEVGGTQNVASLVEVELATYTVPAGLKAQWIGGIASSDGLARFRVTADTIDRIPPVRNSIDALSVPLQAPLEFAAGTVLRVFGYNDTIEGNTNSVSATLYLHTVSI